MRLDALMVAVASEDPRNEEMTDIRWAPLDPKQLGHLRHIRNLSAQPDNDWSNMAAARPMQEDFGAYRYQLAYMFLALALAHRHRLPAAPGVFQPVMDRLIQKMLLPEVWSYWRDTSAGGNPAYPDMPQPTQSNDPVAAMNIMYSGYLHAMTLTYHYLFDDPKYAEPGAISFRMRPMFWGGEGYRFDYDEKSLNDHIYWQMAQSGFLGVACEPGMIFQICNQVPIIGFRMHDFVYGTTLSSDVTAAYRQAWQDFGALTEDGHYNSMILDWRREVVPGQLGPEIVPRLPVWDAWCGTLMHSWNGKFVEDQYRGAIDAFIERRGNAEIAIRVNDALLGDAVDPQHGPTTLCHFGFLATWAAEVGDDVVRDGLLETADRTMLPTWRDGGLFYPRDDRPVDEDGNYRFMDPMTGNALLAFARLCPPGGLKSLYEDRWSAERFAQPALRTVNAEIDVCEASFDPVTNCLRFTLSPPHGADAAEVDIGIGPFDPGVDRTALCAELTDGAIGLQCEGETAIRLVGRIDRTRTFEIRVPHA
jgi:hypothetical protein